MTAEVELAGVVPDVSPTLMSFRASCWGRGVSAPLSVSVCGEESRGGLGVRRLISLIGCKYSMTGLLMRMYKHGPRHLKLSHQGGDWSGPSILTLLHQALERGWSSWTVLMERETLLYGYNSMTAGSKYYAGTCWSWPLCCLHVRLQERLLKKVEERVFHEQLIVLECNLRVFIKCGRNRSAVLQFSAVFSLDKSGILIRLIKSDN